MACDKVRYGSKKAADEDIARIKKKSTRSRVPIRSYQCTVCYGRPWHLTSREDLFKLSKQEEMENKKISDLTEQVKKLKEEISSLKNNAHREINKEVKTDSKVVALNDAIRKLERSLLNSRKDNSELIARIVQLEKQVPKIQA